jgi:hypothetical protein
MDSVMAAKIHAAPMDCSKGRRSPPNALAQSSTGQRRTPEPRDANGCPRGRPTHVFSEKIKRHAFSVALHSTHCNFVSIRMTLRRSHAMAAGIADKLWPIADIAGPIDAAGKSD